MVASILHLEDRQTIQASGGVKEEWMAERKASSGTKTIRLVYHAQLELAHGAWVTGTITHRFISGLVRSAQLLPPTAQLCTPPLSILGSKCSSWNIMFIRPPIWA